MVRTRPTIMNTNQNFKDQIQINELGALSMEEITCPLIQMKQSSMDLAFDIQLIIVFFLSHNTGNTPLHLAVMLGRKGKKKLASDKITN